MRWCCRKLPLAATLGEAMWLDSGRRMEQLCCCCWAWAGQMLGILYDDWFVDVTEG
jgi:hypothetical protein